MSADWPLLEKVIQKILDLVEAGEPLSDLERAAYLAWFFDAEVHNGGFDQFFFNSQGNHAAATLDVLRQIGAPKAAELLRRAMELFGPEGPSGDRDVRWQQMDGIANRDLWNKMDEEYYARDEKVADLLSDFLKSKGVK